MWGVRVVSRRRRERGGKEGREGIGYKVVMYKFASDVV
jgi:hypothetical protein